MSLKTVKLFESVDKSVTEGVNIHNFPQIEDDVEQEINIKVQELTISSSKCCTYCQTTFSDMLEQRAHYKLDWHRYNLKQALIGRATLSADDFSKLSDDVSSISGSESDDDDGDEPKKGSENRLQAFRDARIFWSNRAGQTFSIYRCLLLGRKELKSADVIQEDLVKFVEMPKKWMIVMLGGGHFAGAIFESGVLKAHKTFHCYTVRAKQGGSQSTRDGKGGNHPKSAGASLRRYNEMALIQHVQDILKTWEELISECSLILYRAAGPNNQGVLFGGKSPPLEKNDPRIRSIPLATRRPTLKEVKRVHDVLSNLHYHGSEETFQKNSSFTKQVDEHFGISPKPKNIDRSKERTPQEREIPGDVGAISSDDERPFLVTNNEEMDLNSLKEFDDSIKHKKKRKKPKPPKKENKLEEMRNTLNKICQKGDVQGLEALIKEPRDENSKLTPSEFEECLKNLDDSGDTLLHTAATKCHPEIVEILLDAGCDPSVKNKRKLVPYVVSGDKNVKNAFKNYAAKNPDKYDYKLALIPPPLTEEEEKELLEKKKERKKNKREREKVRKKEEFERKTDEDDRIRFLALSDREKRALAAERRIVQEVTANTSKVKAPVFVRCFQCGKDITGKVPFEYSNQLFCTVVCLKDHRGKTKPKS